MADTTRPDSEPSPLPSGSDSRQGDALPPDPGPVPDAGGRDFGDSAGYGGGGSALDYRDVVGEEPGDTKPNPLDAVIPGDGGSKQD